MALSILSQRLQELGLEHERIADRNCLALANAGQNLEQPIVAITKRNRTPLETVSRAHEYNPRLAHGLDGARWHRERGEAFLDRHRSLYQRARPPVAVRIGDLRHHPCRIGVLVQHRADETDLADVPLS